MQKIVIKRLKKHPNYTKSVDDFERMRGKMVVNDFSFNSIVAIV